MKTPAGNACTAESLTPLPDFATWSRTMSSKALTGLLALALLQASLALADQAIRFTTGEGTKRAEFQLNSDTDCVLENDRISCARARR